MTEARSKPKFIPLLVTVEAAAAKLAISPGKAWQLVKSGLLPTVVIPPRSRRVRVCDVEQIAANGIPAHRQKEKST